MTSQLEKALAFSELHSGNGCFVVPNPWDPGSARLFAELGFRALATTGAGFAYSRGKPDNGVTKSEMFHHLHEITEVTDLPVTADLENGFGDAPEVVSDTILSAAAAGVVGGSIEDFMGGMTLSLYDIKLAAERVQAAAETARALPFPFVLTARCEHFTRGQKDMHDTIRRLQAYQEAGADVLFVPGLMSLEDIRTITQSVDRPVNVIAGVAGQVFTVKDLQEAGVKRVSVGASLARLALASVRRAVTEIRDGGTFGFSALGATGKEMNALFSKFAGEPTDQR